MWNNRLSRVALGVILLSLAAGIAAPDAPTVSAQSQAQARIIPVHSKTYRYQLSPDGRIVATFEISTAYDDIVMEEYLPIRLFDIRSGEEIGQLTGHTDYASSVAFSSDGTLLVSHHPNGYLYVWDVMQGILLKTLPVIPGRYPMDFVPGTQTLVQTTNVAGSSGQIMVWDVAEGAMTRLLTYRFKDYATMREETMDDVRTGAKYSILAFDVSPDGQQIVTASMNGDIWLWDLNAAPGDQPAWLRAGKEDEILRMGMRQIAFSADGQTVFYYNRGRETQGAIYRLDLDSRTETILIEPGEDNEIVGFSPLTNRVGWLCGEGSLLCLADLDRPDHISEIGIVLEGEPVVGSLHHPYMYNFCSPDQALTFTPDGRHVILGGYLVDSGENGLIVIDLP